ncbi:hypothetical protein OG453_38265 [Streptomyces sp. NBC_01381]|uniref:hypothetical protein n=1 Tax=Streptomyces sp. NBC_01381 TaxID=2903845 RepID=UPI0022554411|nr:hypothetical protein [Streptomyces sp. NBC_01381]MCX4672434.1 hypothetical protein [Streptomyces sp. NBC_01381]
MKLPITIHQARLGSTEFKVIRPARPLVHAVLIDHDRHLDTYLDQDAAQRIGGLWKLAASSPRSLIHLPMRGNRGPSRELPDDGTVVGDLTSDPAGATARQEWITELGLWYDEPTDLADWDSVIGPLAAQIEARFNQTCCQLARTLHATGVIERSVGRTVPVIVHELEYYEAIARQTEAANPPGLADAFTSWVRNG